MQRRARSFEANADHPVVDRYISFGRHSKDRVPAAKWFLRGILQVSGQAIGYIGTGIRNTSVFIRLCQEMQVPFTNVNGSLYDLPDAASVRRDGGPTDVYHLLWEAFRLAEKQSGIDGWLWRRECLFARLDQHPEDSKAVLEELREADEIGLPQFQESCVRFAVAFLAHYQDKYQT